MKKLKSKISEIVLFLIKNGVERKQALKMAMDGSYKIWLMQHASLEDIGELSEEAQIGMMVSKGLTHSQARDYVENPELRKFYGQPSESIKLSAADLWKSRFMQLIYEFEAIQYNVLATVRENVGQKHNLHPEIKFPYKFDCSWTMKPLKPEAEGSLHPENWNAEVCRVESHERQNAFRKAKYVSTDTFPSKEHSFVENKHKYLKWKKSNLSRYEQNVLRNQLKIYGKLSTNSFFISDTEPSPFKPKVARTTLEILDAWSDELFKFENMSYIQTFNTLKNREEFERFKNEPDSPSCPSMHVLREDFAKALQIEVDVDYRCWLDFLTEYYYYLEIEMKEQKGGDSNEKGTGSKHERTL
jgi:hypothetical protein